MFSLLPAFRSLLAWALLGHSWPALGTLLGRACPLLVIFGHSWSAIGPLLAALGPLLGHAWAAVWPLLGGSWVALGAPSLHKTASE